MVQFCTSMLPRRQIGLMDESEDRTMEAEGEGWDLVKLDYIMPHHKHYHPPPTPNEQ